MESTLGDLAAAQGGLFTTAQAARSGIKDFALARLRAGGVISGVARGVYAMADTVPDDVVAVHAMKVRAALLLYPDARPCGGSLAVIHGHPVWGLDLDRVDLVRDGLSHEVLTQLCRIRPSDALTRPDTADRDAALAACVVQVALDHGPTAAVVTADRLMHDRVVDAQQIAQIVDRLATRPFAGRAQALVTLMDGRSESVGESRLRILLVTNGVAVTPQVPVLENGRIIARADLGVDGTNQLIEFDGKVKYGGADPEVLWREKKREDRIRRQDYRVKRVIWSHLDRPKILMARLLREIGAASPRNTEPHPTTKAG